MGLFSKKSSVPVTHPPVDRTVYVRADVGAVRAHLDEYSTLFSPKHTTEHVVQVATSGVWTAIRLPAAVHPWQLHNLAFWMLDCDGAEVIARSGAGPTHPAYWLVADPELPDALCGWDESGHGWTVGVPGNEIVRPEDVPVSRSVVCPDGFHSWEDVVVRLEDPGGTMNPSNEPTVATRRRLERPADYVTW